MIIFPAFSKNRGAIRISSFIVATLFTFNTIAWSAPSLPIAPVLLSEEKSETFSKIEIPEAFGKIENNFWPASKDAHKLPFIIHIQDAHSNPEAQRNIQAILEHLVQAYGVRKIALEGASGKLNASTLNFFSNPEANESVADYLLQLGELTGAEFFAFHKKSAAEIYGVDDPALYGKSFKLFRQVKMGKNQISSQMEIYNEQLKKLEYQILNADLKLLLIKHKDWDERKEEVLGYFKVLKTLSKKYLDLDLAQPKNQFIWPDLSRLVKIEEVDALAKPEEGRLEAQKLIEDMERNLGPKARTQPLLLGLRSFAKDQTSFHNWLVSNGKIKTVRAFFEELYSLAKSIQISLLGYPNFLREGGLAILREEIDAISLFEEVERIESQLNEKLAKKEDEKNLLQLEKDFSLLTKLLNLSLTREDDKLYRGRKKFLKSEAIQKRFLLLAPHGSLPLLSESPVRAAEKFYELSRERDNALLENTLKILSSDKSKAAVLITGGFHSRGLGLLMKEKKIPYMVISPRMTRFENSDLYEKVMMGENAELKNLAKSNALVRWLLTDLAQSLQRPGGLKTEEIQNVLLRAFYEKGVPVLRKSGLTNKEIYKQVSLTLQDLGVFKNAKVVWNENEDSVYVLTPAPQGLQRFDLLKGKLEFQAKAETVASEAPATRAELRKTRPAIGQFETAFPAQLITLPNSQAPVKPSQQTLTTYSLATNATVVGALTTVADGYRAAVKPNSPKDEIKKAKDGADVSTKREIEQLFKGLSRQVVMGTAEGGLRDEVESFSAGEGFGAATNPITIYIDVVENTNATAFGNLGGTSIAVTADGENQLIGLIPDVYAHLVVARVPVEKMAEFEKNPLDPDQDSEKLLRRIADANGIKLSDMEVVLLNRERESERLATFKRLATEEGLTVTTLEDGTFNQAVQASIGKKEGKFKVFLGTSGAPEASMNLAIAKAYHGEGTIAGYRLLSNEGLKKAKDLQPRYAWGEKEKELIRELRPEDAEEIIAGKKLFTTADVKGKVDAALTFITDNEIFNLPGVEVLENQNYLIHTLRIHETETGVETWVEARRATISESEVTFEPVRSELRNHQTLLNEIRDEFDWATKRDPGFKNLGFVYYLAKVHHNEDVAQRDLLTRIFLSPASEEKKVIEDALNYLVQTYPELRTKDFLPPNLGNLLEVYQKQLFQRLVTLDPDSDSQWFLSFRSLALHEIKTGRRGSQRLDYWIAAAISPRSELRQFLAANMGDWVFPAAIVVAGVLFVGVKIAEAVYKVSLRAKFRSFLKEGFFNQPGNLNKENWRKIVIGANYFALEPWDARRGGDVQMPTETSMLALQALDAFVWTIEAKPDVEKINWLSAYLVENEDAKDRMARSLRRMRGHSNQDVREAAQRILQSDQFQGYRSEFRKNYDEEVETFYQNQGKETIKRLAAHFELTLPQLQKQIASQPSKKVYFQALLQTQLLAAWQEELSGLSHELNQKQFQIKSELKETLRDNPSKELARANNDLVVLLMAIQQGQNQYKKEINEPVVAAGNKVTEIVLNEFKKLGWEKPSGPAPAEVTQFLDLMKKYEEQTRKVHALFLEATDLIRDLESRLPSRTGLIPLRFPLNPGEEIVIRPGEEVVFSFEAKPFSIRHRVAGGGLTLSLDQAFIYDFVQRNFSLADLFTGKPIRGEEFKPDFFEMTLERRSISAGPGKKEDVIFAANHGTINIVISHYKPSIDEERSFEVRLELRMVPSVSEEKQTRAELRAKAENLFEGFMDQIDEMHGKAEFYQLALYAVWGRFSKDTDEREKQIADRVRDLKITEQDLHMLQAWATDTNHRLASVEDSIPQVFWRVLDYFNENLSSDEMEKIISDRRSGVYKPGGKEENGLFPADHRVTRLFTKLIIETMQSGLNHIHIAYEQEGQSSFLVWTLTDLENLNNRRNFKVLLPQFLDYESRVSYDSFVLFLKKSSDLDSISPDHFLTLNGAFQIQAADKLVEAEVEVTGHGDSPEEVNITLQFPQGRPQLSREESKPAHLFDPAKRGQANVLVLGSEKLAQGIFKKLAEKGYDPSRFQVIPEDSLSKAPLNPLIDQVHILFTARQIDFPNMIWPEAFRPLLSEARRFSLVNMPEGVEGFEYMDHILNFIETDLAQNFPDRFARAELRANANNKAWYKPYLPLVWTGVVLGGGMLTIAGGIYGVYRLTRVDPWAKIQSTDPNDQRQAISIMKIEDLVKVLNGDFPVSVKLEALRTLGFRLERNHEEKGPEIAEGLIRFIQSGTGTLEQNNQALMLLPMIGTDEASDFIFNLLEKKSLNLSQSQIILALGKNRDKRPETIEKTIAVLSQILSSEHPVIKSQTFEAARSLTSYLYMPGNPSGEPRTSATNEIVNLQKAGHLEPLFRSYNFKAPYNNSKSPEVQKLLPATRAMIRLDEFLNLEENKKNFQLQKLREEIQDTHKWRISRAWQRSELRKNIQPFVEAIRKEYETAVDQNSRLANLGFVYYLAKSRHKEEFDQRGLLAKIFSNSAAEEEQIVQDVLIDMVQTYEGLNNGNVIPQGLGDEIMKYQKAEFEKFLALTPSADPQKFLIYRSSALEDIRKGRRGSHHLDEWITKAISAGRSELRTEAEDPEKKAVRQQVKTPEGTKALISEVSNPQVTQPRVLLIIEALTRELIDSYSNPAIRQNILQIQKAIQNSPLAADPEVEKDLQQMATVDNLMLEFVDMENGWKKKFRALQMEVADLQDLREQFDDIEQIHEQLAKLEEQFSQLSQEGDVNFQVFADTYTQFLQAWQALDGQILSLEGQLSDETVLKYIQWRKDMSNAHFLNLIEQFQEALRDGELTEGAHVFEISLSDLRSHFETLSARFEATIKRINSGRSELRTSSHDVRGDLMERAKEAFGAEADQYIFYPGGFGSIDIMPKGISKQSAIGNLFKQQNLDFAVYFGDEFYQRDKKKGNDTPLLAAQKDFEGTSKKLILFSVDEKPEDRTAEAKEKTLWIGAGPAASKKVLNQIKNALETGKTEVVITGQGPDAQKSVTISLQELVSKGALVFDVDGTILSKKDENFSNEPEIRGIFAGLLTDKVRMGIISGNSKAEQKTRIADHLKIASELADRSAISRFTLYVNGGATRVSYAASGDETSVNLAGDLPKEGIQKVAEIVRQEAGKNFGLSDAEIQAWSAWFNFNGQYGTRPDFPNVNFVPWWSVEAYVPDIADSDAIKAASPKKRLVVSEPYVELRDNVQLSIKLLPKSVDIPASGTPLKTGRFELRAVDALEIVKKIQGFSKKDPVNHTDEIIELTKPLLTNQEFEAYDQVREIVLDALLRKNDLEIFSQFIDWVYTPILSRERTARRILAVIQKATAVRDEKINQAEGEKYLQDRIRWQFNGSGGVLDRFHSWKKEFDPEDKIQETTEEDLRFATELIEPVLGKIGEFEAVPAEIADPIRDHFIPKLNDEAHLDRDTIFRERIRHFNSKLVLLPFSSDSDRQIAVFKLFSRAVMGQIKESPVLLTYLITQFSRYGYAVPESNEDPALDFMDMINKASQPSVVYLLKFLAQIIFSAHSGQMTVGAMEPERNKTRQGQYNVGLYGIIREQIHNYLGMHVLGLLERQFEYYRTGDVSTLYSQDYKVDAFKGRAAVPRFEVSRFPETISNDESSPDQESADFMRALYPRVMALRGNNTFYERLRTLSSPALQTIIDEVNKELGKNYNLENDNLNVVAYLWTYRRLSARYSMGGIQQMFGLFKSVNPLYNWDDVNALLKAIDEGRNTDALKKIATIKLQLKEEIYKINPRYNRMDIIQRLREEHGRDDIGNAVGGERIKDMKFTAYQADFYLSQIENHLIESVFSGQFSNITQDNLKDAVNFIRILSDLGYVNGDFTLDQVDHADALYSPADLSVKRDILRLMLRETSQTDAYFDRLVRPTVEKITSQTSEKDLESFILRQVVQASESKQDKIKQAVVISLNQMRRVHAENRVLKKLLETLQPFFDIENLLPQTTATQLPSYIVLGANSTQEEINQALQLGRYRLGAKGIGLIRALKLGIEVPPFAIFSSELNSTEIELLLPEVLEKLDQAIKGQKNMGLGSAFASGDRPYFLSFRAGSYLTAPGQYLTVTNVGMTEENVGIFAKRLEQYGLSEENARWTAWDSYRRFLEDYGMGVFQITKESFDRAIEGYKSRANVSLKENLSADQMKEVAQLYLKEIASKAPRGFEIPSPLEQLPSVVDAIKLSSEKAEPYLKAKGLQGTWPGPSIIVQAMAYGNIRSESGAGIVYTRNPNSYVLGLSGDYKLAAQGKDLADASVRPLRYEDLPYQPWQDFVENWAEKLERETGANVEMEITVQRINGSPMPWLLQARDAYIPDTAPIFTEEPNPEDVLIKENQSRGAAGGAFRGIVVYSKEDVPSEAEIKKQGADGVILLTPFVKPEDVPTLLENRIKAVITTRGGYVSHTADIARELNIPAVVGARTLFYDEKQKVWKAGNKPIPKGAKLSIDGRTGRVSNGFLKVKTFPALQLEKPVEEKKAPVFNYDASEKPLVVQTPVRMAINLGAYRVNKKTGVRSDLLESNFEGVQEVAKNTVANRVFDAYLREIIGDPNISLTDIYGVEDVETSLFPAIKSNLFHGPFPSTSLALRKQGAIYLLIINGHEIKIHPTVPLAETLKTNQTEYLVDFSNINLTDETLAQREERLKKLQEGAGLKKVFAFSGDEDPSNEVAVPGLNENDFAKKSYVPLASPFTASLSQVLRVVQDQLKDEIDMFSAAVPARPMTGDAGNINFLNQHEYASGLRALFPEIAPVSGRLALPVEYAVEKGATNTFVTLVPKPGSRLKDLAKELDKIKKDKTKNDDEKKKARKKLIDQEINSIFEKAATDETLSPYLRYGAGKENLNSLLALRDRRVVFDSQYTDVKENGQIVLYFHAGDISYGVALNRLIKSLTVRDKIPAQPSEQKSFALEVEQGKWKEGTIAPNLKSSVKKIVAEGDEVGFGIIGVRGRIGKGLWNRLTSNPNYRPVFMLGVRNIETVITQLKEDPAQGSMDVERDDDYYILEKETETTVRLRSKKTGEYLTDPKTGQPYSIYFGQIQEPTEKEKKDNPDAYAQNIRKALGQDRLDQVEVIFNATGAFMDNKKYADYYNSFVSGQKFKRIIFTAPPKDEADIIVARGVNEADFVKAIEDSTPPRYCSGASCTTTGIGRAVIEFNAYLKSLGYEVEYIEFITHHGITPSQGEPHGPAESKKDLRSALGPIKAVHQEDTGANKVVTKIWPELSGKFSGVSHRDGNFAGSVLIMSATIRSKDGKYLTPEEINAHFQQLAANPALEGILQYAPEVVSTAQIAGNKTPSIFVPQFTNVEVGRKAGVATIALGYDNEIGYTAAVAHIDWLAALAGREMATPENVKIGSARDFQFSQGTQLLASRLTQYLNYNQNQLGLEPQSFDAYRRTLEGLAKAIKIETRVPSGVLQAVGGAAEAIVTLARDKNGALEKVAEDLTRTYTLLNSVSNGKRNELRSVELQQETDFRHPEALDLTKLRAQILDTKALVIKAIPYPGAGKSSAGILNDAGEQVRRGNYLTIKNNLLEARQLLIGENPETLSLARAALDGLIKTEENLSKESKIALGLEKFWENKVTRRLKADQKAVGDPAQRRKRQATLVPMIADWWAARHYAPVPGLAHEQADTRFASNLDTPTALAVLERLADPIYPKKYAEDFGTHVFNWPTPDPEYFPKQALEWQFSFSRAVAASAEIRSALLKNEPVTFVLPRQEGHDPFTSKTTLDLLWGKAGYEAPKIVYDRSKTGVPIYVTFTPRRLEVTSARAELRRAPTPTQLRDQYQTLSGYLNHPYENVRWVSVYVAFGFLSLLPQKQISRVLPFLEWDLQNIFGKQVPAQAGSAAGLNILITNKIPDTEKGTKEQKETAEEYYFAVKKALEEDANLFIQLLAVGGDPKTAARMNSYFTSSYPFLADRFKVRISSKLTGQNTLQKIINEVHKQAQMQRAMTGGMTQFLNEHVTMTADDRNLGLLEKMLSGYRVLNDVAAHPGAQGFLIRKLSKLVLQAEEIRQYRELQSRIISATNDLFTEEERKALSMAQRLLDDEFHASVFYRSA